MRSLLLALVAPLFLLAAPVPEENVTPPDVKKFDEAIRELLDGTRPLGSVRIDIMWSGNAVGRQVDLHGNGVVFVDRQKQIKLTKEEVRKALDLLAKAEFGRLPDSYGGMKLPPGGGRGIPIRMLGHVNVTIQGVTKACSQISGGEQSDKLAKLVADLVNLSAGTGREAVTVTSLADGIDKISKGTLDPLALGILVQRVIEQPGQPGEGFLLRIEGNKVMCQSHAREKGYSPTKTLILERKELEALTKLILDNKAAEFPVNLWAVTYTDFNLRVLGLEKSMQARQFAGKTPETHGEQQKQFDRIYAQLEALAQRTLKEGK
jgi:hypothetical protein